MSLELLNILKSNGAYKSTSYTKNEAIIHKGDIATHLYVIINGSVKISCLHRNGQEVILVLLNQNQTFGGNGAFHDLDTNYIFKSVIETTVIEIYCMDDIYEMIKKNHNLQRELFRIWGEKYTMLEQRIRVLNIKSTLLRFIEVLMEFKEKFGYSCPDTNEIIINSPLDQEGIANYIRTTRVSVNTIIHQLKYASLIEYEKQKIVLKNDFFEHYKSIAYNL
ncbi:Crp/Fnr family transcriptional regulator [Aquimarina sp. I32.4]|uniref:Crp/Fnr family transcriptional regulator n=1 Tax=Aquimarina sp. I32.4 TaxID=2053903 RepID=UPI000CDF24A6|nr:Crp/Fnr family transcriptional regulator [Aquimarina sp. I32.4]